MAKRDYYEVLGLSKGSGQDEIKKAYRRIAGANHPDRNPGDADAEERFKEATEAYEVLADDKKRRIYDQYGFAGLKGQATSGDFSHSHVFRDFGDLFGGDGGGFSDIFSSIFGGGRSFSGRRSQEQTGADLRYPLNISFMDMVTGVEREIRYPRSTLCDRCDGNGSEKGSHPTTCPSCGGVGESRRSMGFFSMSQTCGQCGGSGKVISNPCKQCDGHGIVKAPHRVSVSIPAGIENGEHIVVASGGNFSRGGAGDLYVQVSVEPHESYQRKGQDIYCAIAVHPFQMMLGATITVPTLSKRRVRIKIPSGSQYGQRLRLRGEGLPSTRGFSAKGDLYFLLHIRIPKRLSSKERALMEELMKMAKNLDTPDIVPLDDL